MNFIAVLILIVAVIILLPAFALDNRLFVIVALLLLLGLYAHHRDW